MTDATTTEPSPPPDLRTPAERLRDALSPLLGTTKALAYERIHRLAGELSFRRGCALDAAIAELSGLDPQLLAALLAHGPTEAVRVLAPPAE